MVRKAKLIKIEGNFEDVAKCIALNKKMQSDKNIKKTIKNKNFKLS